MITCFRSTIRAQINKYTAVMLEHLGYEVQARYCAGYELRPKDRLEFPVFLEATWLVLRAVMHTLE